MTQHVPQLAQTPPLNYNTPMLQQHALPLTIAFLCTIAHVSDGGDPRLLLVVPPAGWLIWQIGTEPKTTLDYLWNLWYTVTRRN